MDAATAMEKLHARLTADLEADRTSRAIAPTATAAPDTEITEPTNDDVDDGPAEPSILAAPPTVADDPVQPVPQPANDRDEIELRRYARGPETSAPGREVPPVTYMRANPEDVARPDRESFYEPSYRGDLRRMVDHVVSQEAPIYFDVLVERIARAHGFQRSGEVVQKTVWATLGKGRFPSSRDGDRHLIWPADAEAVSKTAFRGAGGRDHGDIPLPELAGLAEILRARELEEKEEIIRGMQDHFGLGRLAASTRERFEVATKLVSEAIEDRRR